MARTRHQSGNRDDDLLARFVATFAQLDDLMCLPREPVPDELAVSGPPGWNWWRPAAIATGRDQLADLYSKVPGPFPALYEQLVLSYRWLEVDLGTARLLPNPPGPNFDGLAEGMLRDRALTNTLLPAGLIPFGKATGVCYDPMCFDIKARKGDDCSIIQVEHESVLCHDRIGKAWQRYPSFRELVCDTIDRAQSNRG